MFSVHIRVLWVVEIGVSNYIHSFLCIEFWFVKTLDFINNFFVPINIFLLVTNKVRNQNIKLFKELFLGFYKF